MKPLCLLGHHYCIVSLLLLVIQACTSTVQEVVTISVDLKKITEVDIDKLPNLQTIIFDQTDVLLSGHGQALWDDSMILVEDRDSVMAFDHQGKYLFVVARKGRGRGEYNEVTSLFTDEENIYIHSRSTMLIFNHKGALIKEISLTSELQEDAPIKIYPAGSHRFIARKESDPALSLLDKDFSFMHQITGKNAVNFFIYDIGPQFSPYGDELLFWDALCDTIFAVKDLEKIYPKYYVNFGENSIPKSVRKKGTYEVLYFLYDMEDDADRYATSLKDIHEGQTYVTAFFWYKEGLLYVLKYDKQKKQAFTYKLIDSGTPLEFPFFYHLIHTQGDKIMYYSGLGNDVKVLIIDIEDLP